MEHIKSVHIYDGSIDDKLWSENLLRIIKVQVTSDEQTSIIINNLYNNK